MKTEELVHASQAGDMNSFICLLKFKENTIYRIARAYSSNSYDAEDCISEAVIHAYDKIEQLKNPDKFNVWFISILINICRKRCKAAARVDEYKIEIHDYFDESTIRNSENAIIVENILRHLNQNERDVLVLRYLRDFSLQETAEILGIPCGTVKSRLNRTLSKIKLKYGRLSNELR